MFSTGISYNEAESAIQKLDPSMRADYEKSLSDLRKAETFYMNLWREGRIGCFSPVTYLSRRDLTLIRPMLLATEQEVISAVNAEGLPIVKSVCPADGVTVREQTKEFVKERCRTDHAFRQKTLHALQESGIDGWRPVHTGRGSFAITNEEE